MMKPIENTRLQDDIQAYIMLFKVCGEDVYVAIPEDKESYPSGLALTASSFTF